MSSLRGASPKWASAAINGYWIGWNFGGVEHRIEQA
jgi:hypothetical protein